MTMPSLTAAGTSPLARAVPYLALVGSMVSFCVGASFAKQLFPTLGVPGTIAYRTGFAAVILLVAFRPWRQPLTRADLFATTRYGAALGIMNFTFYMALRTIPLGVAMAIEFLGPLIVSVLHSRRPFHFAMIGLAVAGLGLLLPLRGVDHALDPIGVAFALCAALCWGLYIVLGKRTGHLPGGQAVALGMTTAALIVVPFGIYDAGMTLLTPSLALVGLVVANLSGTLPYLLDMIALKRIPAYRYGVMMSADPAIAALVGTVVLAEHLSKLQCLAIALVVAAAVGSVTAADARDTQLPA